MSTSFHSFSKVMSHSFTWNTFLCLILLNSVFISVGSVSSFPNLGGEPVLPMSCGPSTLPSGHRALCSRLSLCGLCAPFSCGKTDYCSALAGGAGPWPIWFWGCALFNELYPLKGRVGLPCGSMFDPGGRRVAAGPLLGGVRPLALTGCENSKWWLSTLVLSWQSKFSKVPASPCPGGVIAASCLPGSRISKQAWPRVLSNWHLHWVVYTL